VALTAISTRSPAVAAAMLRAMALPIPSTSRSVPAGMPGRHVDQVMPPRDLSVAWVVGGLTPPVRPGERNGRHLGAACPSPVTNRSETHRSSRPLPEGSAGGQGVLQAIWRVGVVDQHSRKAFRASRVFQPARTRFHGARGTRGMRGWPPAAGAMPRPCCCSTPTPAKQVHQVEGGPTRGDRKGHGPAAYAACRWTPSARSSAPPSDSSGSAAFEEAAQSAAEAAGQVVRNFAPQDHDVSPRTARQQRFGEQQALASKIGRITGGSRGWSWLRLVTRARRNGSPPPPWSRRGNSPPWPPGRCPPQRPQASWPCSSVGEAVVVAGRGAMAGPAG